MGDGLRLHQWHVDVEGKIGAGAGRGDGQRVIDLASLERDDAPTGVEVTASATDRLGTDFAAFEQEFAQDPATVDPDPAPLVGGLVDASKGAALAKRAMDVVGSVVAAVVLAPIIALTALAVGLTSRGPVFYVQERVGRRGRPFKMVKFRSMHQGADEQREDYLTQNECSGPVFKIRDDPRMTRVGRVIRRLSIDELPQIFNVLRGDMSLVGPRPPLPEEVANYTRAQARRLAVTPGLTCIWQGSGRSDIDFEQWVEMDLEYIQGWTLRLDIALLLRTVPAVLSGKGAS